MKTSRLVIGIAVLALSSCTLRDYESGVVGCDDDAACPATYACLDPKNLKFKTCVKIGCGDGQRDLNRGEQCDDGDDNELDACVECVVKHWQEEPVLGFGPGKGVRGDTPIGRPTVVTHDSDGNVFISSIGTNTITRLDNKVGTLTTFAGNGSVVSAETGAAVPANEVATLFTSSIAVDGLGNVFFADLQKALVRRIDAVTGDTVTVAGSGAQGTGEDNVPGTQSSLDKVVALALDGDGNLFIAEKQSGGTGINRVRRLDRRTNIITTVIIDRKDGEASEEELRGPPDDIAFDADGRLFVFTNTFDSSITEPSPRVGRTFTRDFTVSYAVTILTLSNQGAFVSKEYVEVDLRIDRRTFTEVDVDADNNGVVDRVEPVESTRELLVKVSDCEAPDRLQERIAVSDDGSRIFHLAGRRVLQLQLPTPDEPANCTEIGRVPGGADDGAEEPASAAGFPLVPTDLSWQGGNLLVADPGSGVVWGLRDDQSNPLAEPSVGKQNDVPAGLEPSDALVGDLVFEFAKQTDGHVGLAATTACRQRGNNGAPVDDGIDFEDFDLFAPFPDLHQVVLYDCNGVIAAIAGNGVAGFAGDGGPAVDAKLSGPTAVVRGLDGDIYVADRDNNRIRRIFVVNDNNPTTNDVQRPTITTFIGAHALNDTPAKHAIGEAADLVLDRPSGLALDHTGALLISDATHRIQRVVMVAAEGENVGDVTTIFGTGIAGFNGDDKPANQTQLDEPAAIVFLPFSLLKGFPFVPPGGVLIVAERGGHRIRATIVPPLGEPSVYTLAGTGEPGDDDNVDGSAARFVHPRGLMLAPPTNAERNLGFFVVDAIDRVRQLDVAVSFDVATGLILAGSVSTATATTADGVRGLPSRDDGADGLFRAPQAMAFLDADRLAVTDALTGRLRLVTLSTNEIRTISGMPAGTRVGNAGADAFVAEPLRTPGDIVFDASGVEPTLWVSEAGAGRLRRFVVVDPADPSTWRTSKVVVSGLVAPAGLALDTREPAKRRELYVTDKVGHVVVAVDLNDVPDDGGDDDVIVEVAASNIAGVAGRRGVTGDDGSASAALLNEPGSALFTAVGSESFLFIADTGNNRVRRVALSTRTITTVLGDGSAASGGEGSPSSAFPVHAPRGLAVDAAGNLFVTSTNAIRLVQSGDGGVVDGNGDVVTIYGQPTDKSDTESVTRCLAGLALSPTPTHAVPLVYVVDSCVGLLVRLQRD
jgi:sugar lactone lactonase YvrE